jgi:hypothetical protein
MPVNDQQLAQAVTRVAHDLSATLGWDAQQAAAYAEQTIGASFGVAGVEDWIAARGSFAVKLAEDVQQQLHDTFVDTTWPTCPLHPRHPLWLDDERSRAVWRCTKSGVDIAPLGSLAAST